MITILSKIYSDEILYSIIARYHKLSGNIAFKDTLMDAFGSNSLIPTLEFPCHLDYLASLINLNEEFDSNYLINKTTLIPLYLPFLSPHTKNEILQDMKYGDGKGLKYKIGFIAGGICKKTDIYYCPICAREEIAELGEAYIHRLHQVQGIYICRKHLCKLVPYGNKNTRSRLEFITVDEDSLVKECDYLNDDSITKWQLDICYFAQFILINTLMHFNQSLVRDRYLQILNEKGYMTAGGRIKQTELMKAFKLFYGDRLLDSMESNIDENSDYNWLQQISRKPKSIIHPIRHILFMRFLCNDPEEFFFDVRNRGTSPFGNGPWPCLNICCKNYKKATIKKCIVSADYKTREPVGTFKCGCGFTYSRKSDRSEFKIGRVKEFGYVWEAELEKLIRDGAYTLRGIARKLDCDPKTVLKYAEKLNIRHILNSKMEIPFIDKVKSVSAGYNLGDSYKEDVLNLIKSQSNITRQQIRKSLIKQYIWLYRNDKEWLNSNLPLKVKPSPVNNRVNWELRDIEICEMLKSECEKLLSLAKPVRITRSLLSRRIGKQELIEKWLTKLPRTKQLTEQLVETVEQFQMRRVNIVCNRLLESRRTLTRSNIVRAAGLRKEVACCVDEVIEQNIKNKLYIVESAIDI